MANDPGSPFVTTKTRRFTLGESVIAAEAGVTDTATLPNAATRPVTSHLGRIRSGRAKRNTEVLP
jgi:hypothetical protein